MRSAFCNNKYICSCGHGGPTFIFYSTLCLHLPIFPEKGDNMPELSFDQWQEVEAKYKTGVSMRELERQYDTSRTAIRDHLRRRGLVQKPIKVPMTKIPTSELLDAIKHYTEYGQYEKARKLASFIEPEELRKRALAEVTKRETKYRSNLASLGEVQSEENGSPPAPAATEL